MTPLPAVRAVETYYDSADRCMRNTAGDMTYAFVRLARGQDEGVGALHRLRDQLASDQLGIRLGGELATDVNMRTL